jgi:hypothetical protein
MKSARFRTGRWSRIGKPAVALVAVAIGGAAVLTSCAGGAGQHAAASRTAAGRTASRVTATPVVAIGQFTGRAPSEIGFSADGGNVVTGLRWQSWTASGAAGQGTSGIESCVPNCAQGSVRYVPTTITLSSPVNGKFTVITEKRNGQTATAKWPVMWPLDAS